MVWVNILWLISLVLSLTCALIATLLQQWARRYIETPKSADLLRHRARVRSLLLVGARLYKIPLIVEILPTLLHLSVFLFLGGLVITFHTIHKRVAIAVDVAVGLSGLAYTAMSILPCLDVRCPYRTPISNILWYPYHAFLSLAAFCLHNCIRGLQRLVLSRGKPLRWIASRASDHRQYFANGLEKSIVYRAVQKLKDGDCRRVNWLFNQLALGDRSKFLKFTASIPRHQVPDLILRFLPTKLDSITLKSLLALLQNCVLGAFHLADEDVRRRSLLVCLHAIYHIAKAPTLPDLDFMRAHLGNTDYMGILLRDNDSFIRTISRSIYALVAQKVVRKDQLGEADLRWLQHVIRESPNAILETSVIERDQMNFKAFVINTQPYSLSNLSTEDAAIFKETLAILLNEQTDGQNDADTSDLQICLSEEIERIHQYNPEDGRQVFDILHGMFPSLVAPFSESAEARSLTSPQTIPHHPPVVIPQPGVVHGPIYPPTVVGVDPTPQPPVSPVINVAPVFNMAPSLPSVPPLYYYPPPGPPPVVPPSRVSRTPSRRSRSRSPAPRPTSPAHYCHLM